MAEPNNVKSIFLTASEKPPSERSAFLDEAVGGDAALRNRVETLLRAHDNPDSFLQQPAVEFGATVDLAPVEPLPFEGPGAMIGRYKLLQQIGEGGFGVVFMAEQEEPVRRLVALKIIKLGMDTRQVVARFEAERQALAMMDHPSVAKVLDGGATATGRLYFVMELVKGIPITEYCDKNNLSIEKRLELFGQVCQAVQHAHQKGLIHRDIKPSNVLVSTQDDRPAAKVIDFGVAKAVQARLTEKTLFTEFQQLVGTPAYMSPEQADGNLDIDTRSDVYSLGVLLYELLAGSPPFDPKELRSKAFAEMQRIIREVEPPTPSTRLSTLTDTLPSVAAQRSVEPRRLAAKVRGELDWIVMRCLEKDRKRRYQTASSLADDLERYLTDQPVEARPATRMYRLNKFIRRNKVGVLAGSAIVVALLLGLAMATVGFVQSHRQEQIAIAQAAKATAISDFLQQMLKSANPVAAKGGEYTVRQMLDDFSAGLGDQLHDQPEVEAAIRATIGNTYLYLNKPDQAEPHLKAALQIRQRLFGENHQDVASSYFDCASRISYYGKYAEGEELLRKSLAIYEKLGIENGDRIEALSQLGWLMFSQKRFREAEAVYEKARDMALKQPNPDRQPQLATILQWQAQITLGLGDTAKAEQMAREAVALHRRLRGSHHIDTVVALQILAFTLGEQQKFHEAEQYYREAIAICREDHYSDADIRIQYLLAGLAYMLHAQGDQAALAALDAEQSANATSVLAECDKDIALYPNSWVLLSQRARIYALQGDFERAAADLARAAELAPEIGALSYERAIVCFVRKDDAGFRQASKAFADAAMRGADVFAGQLAATAFTLTPDSEIDSRQALEFAERTLETGPQNGFALGLLGATLYRVGRYEEAAQRLTESLDTYGEYLAKTGLNAYAYLFLAMTNHRLGHSKEAKNWLDRAVQVIEAHQGVAADRLNSIVLQRLRQEAEALLGVAVKREAVETIEQQSPTVQPQPSTDVNLPSNRPANPDAAAPTTTPQP